MKVLATRGDGIYLLDLGKGQGRIVHVDTRPARIWPPRSIDSILKFGYWDSFEGDPGPILRAAAQAVEPGGGESQ